VVAHVADPASDTLTLFVGEREVVVHDRDLVGRLLGAAGSYRRTFPYLGTPNGGYQTKPGISAVS
jgi:hypothetical protein